MNILVSACLLGINCRYNGTGELHISIQKLLSIHNLIPVCPEVFGGMTIPRQPAEIKDFRVMSITGDDVTKNFENGALETLKLAKLFNCTLAILKEKSPSCGVHTIYDGNFNGKLIKGSGKTTDLLLKNGIKVINESEIINYFNF